MGLIVNCKAPGDIPVMGAYVRVESVQLANGINTFTARRYVAKDAPVAFDSAVYSTAYDINGANPFRQAYECLKTLPEFVGAIDEPDPIDGGTQ